MEQKHLDYLAQLGPIMPADAKPVHVGWYAREYAIDGWLAARDYWDGAHWHVGNDGGQMDAEPERINTQRWRGVAAFSAPAIADAMLADAVGFAPVDAFTDAWLDEYDTLPGLKPWQVFAIAVAVIAVIATIAYLVK